MRIFSYAGLVAGLVLACAPPSTTRTAGDPNVITRDEILASRAGNAYDAVSQLRPIFLRFHGQTSVSGSDTGYPKVYLDRILFGDLSSLKSLDANSISEIHYYDGAAASNRFGLSNGSGAIEVISYK
jgi:hypothetical protein